jgi:hypothetical protein
MNDEESLGGSLDVPELIPIDDYDAKKVRFTSKHCNGNY